jgi:hypothetical protein
MIGIKNPWSFARNWMSKVRVLFYKMARATHQTSVSIKSGLFHFDHNVLLALLRTIKIEHKIPVPDHPSAQSRYLSAALSIIRSHQAEDVPTPRVLAGTIPLTLLTVYEILVTELLAETSGGAEFQISEGCYWWTVPIPLLPQVQQHANQFIEIMRRPVDVAHTDIKTYNNDEPPSDVGSYVHDHVELVSLILRP